MVISAAQLVSASALPIEYVSFSVGADTYIIVNKAHQGPGFPRRELELFTVSQIHTAGPLFLDASPRRIEILDKSFHLLSAVFISGTTVRLFYNVTSPEATLTMFYTDIDPTSLQITAPEVTLSFSGFDPWIMDGRSGAFPSRFYLMYVLADGSNEVRVSDDLGVSWSVATVIDPAVALVRQAEATFNDPLTTKISAEVLQRRDI